MGPSSRWTFSPPTTRYAASPISLRTMDRLYEVAEAVFYYHQALMVEEGLSRWNVGRTYADAAHSVIRAYLKGKPCPATPRLARLTALIAEGAAQILEEIDEDLPDPLGPNDG
jgi:hypothetical protein